MILESNEENVECVKCSECPVVSDTQMQCPDNAIATECTCKSHNSCNHDTICNGTQILIPSDSFWDDYEDLSCDGLQVQCKCNKGFCRESGEYETIPTTFGSRRPMFGQIIRIGLGNNSGLVRGPWIPDFLNLKLY